MVWDVECAHFLRGACESIECEFLKQNTETKSWYEIRINEENRTHNVESNVRVQVRFVCADASAAMRLYTYLKYETNMEQKLGNSGLYLLKLKRIYANYYAANITHTIASMLSNMIDYSYDFYSCPPCVINFYCVLHFDGISDDTMLTSFVIVRKVHFFL